MKDLWEGIYLNSEVSMYLKYGSKTKSSQSANWSQTDHQFISRINLDLWNLAKVNGNLSNAMHATHISDNSQFSYHRVKYNDHEDASEKP